MTALDLDRLVCRYPAGISPALDGLSLSAEKGELVAVVGPNGAGKSTLALAVKGLLAPEKGVILVDGAPSFPPGVPDRRVGLLFSDPENQMVTSVVEEDIAFGLEAQGLPADRIRRRVDEVVAEFGLSSHRRSLPHHLSGGEQQRVALAGVLAPGPGLLILDEPTAFLDPGGKRLLMEALGRLRGAGKTVLLITHDMEEAAASDRVLLLAAGRARWEGTPSRLFDLPGLMEEGNLLPPLGSRLRRALLKRGVEVPETASWEAILDQLPPPPKPSFSAPPPTCPPLGPAGRKGTPLLHARGLGFSYGAGVGVLSACEMELFPGEVSLLVGANGSGKSTLLTLLAGLSGPDCGEVLFCGEALAGKGRGPMPSRVAMVFQHPERQLFSETVGEDIAFGPRNLGVPGGEVDRRVAEAADLVGLSPSLLSRSPFHLSGGQRRRAALAGVLALRPRVLLLDEPTDGLDPAGAREFISRLPDLARRTGAAVLVATHQVPELIGVFDRLLVLAGGRIAAAGPPREVLAGRPLPDAFLPPHLWAQGIMTARGYRPGPIELDPDGAVEAMAGAVAGGGPSGRPGG